MTTSTTSTTANGALIQFSGLASGLDTASIISSLMGVEEIPQQQLQTRAAAEQAQITALQSINTSVAGLATTAQSFMTGSTWTQLAATSSNTAFSVTASSTSTQAKVNVSVSQSATSAAAQLSSAVAAGAFTAGSTYTITDSKGTATTFTVGGTGSISDIAKAINATNATSKLSAVVIDPTSSSPTLQLSTSATGQASNFTITDADGNTVLDTSATGSAGITTTSGADAHLNVNGVAMTSSSNTMTIMPGVQLTIPGNVTSTGTAATTTVSVTDNGSSRASALSLFVQQVNSVLSSISSATAYGAITAGQAATGGGVLAGNTDLRDVATQLVGTIFAPGNTVSLANMGLSVDDSGNLTFDSSAFQSAYQADPQGVQDAFIGADGFINRVNSIAYQASAPSGSSVKDLSGNTETDASGQTKTFTGSLTATIASMNSEVTDLNSQISDWTDRLQMKQAALEKQYSDLETTLSNLQSQQSWLSSQLSSLDSGWAQNQ